ncbi:hypothetical protein D3C72_2328580 [compost metagenome]
MTRLPIKNETAALLYILVARQSLFHPTDRSATAPLYVMTVEGILFTCRARTAAAGATRE